MTHVTLVSFVTLISFVTHVKLVTHVNHIHPVRRGIGLGREGACKDVF